MRYISIATINGEMFRNVETSARTKDKAEKIAEIILKGKYVGTIQIIKTEEKAKWEKLVKSLK